MSDERPSHWIVWTLAYIALVLALNAGAVWVYPMTKHAKFWGVF